MKIYTDARRKLNRLSLVALYELNLALRRHINNTQRDKSKTRKPLAQVLTKHFSNRDSALAAFDLLRNRLSEQGIPYLPTNYGIMVLSQDIDEALFQ